MKRLFVVLALLFVFTGSSFAYDKELAGKFDAMFSQMTQEVLAIAPCQITPEKVLEMLNKNEEFYVLDIRTPAEQNFVGFTFKNSLHIPMNQVFKKENLEKLPKNKKIVVVCHSGTRAAPTTMALRMIGFENAVMLRGGISALAAAVTPKTLPLEK